jgi:hypothetical protein
MNTENAFEKYVAINFRELLTTVRGHAVAELVEALFYKPEGRGFESRLGHWIFQLT